MKKETLSCQLRSIVIYQFLNLYNNLEQKIRKAFQNDLSKAGPEDINRLYFFYGGKIGTYIDYENSITKLIETKFQKNEKFSELTICQILKINKCAKFIESLIFEINSIQRPSTVLEFQDCALKLLNMRNILSHELVDCVFKDKDIIELLSDENIKKFDFDFIKNYDFNLMDDITKAIISNFYYMQIMANKLGD